MTVYTYRGRVLDVHDGDTVKMAIPLYPVRRNARLRSDIGFHLHVEDFPDRRYLTLHAPMRFLGLNAPELRTPAGQVARDYLLTLISPGDIVTLTSSVATHDIAPDKFGDRWDAVITRADGLNVNREMISSGHAQPWDGTGTKPV